MWVILKFIIKNALPILLSHAIKVQVHLDEFRKGSVSKDPHGDRTLKLSHDGLFKSRILYSMLFTGA